jgi:hypothetical protein
MQQTVLWLQTWTAAIVLLVLAATFIVGLVLRTTADRIPPICNKLVADECVSLTRARTRLWRLQRSGKPSSVTVPVSLARGCRPAE